jgi:hypothetical protein
MPVLRRNRNDRSVISLGGDRGRRPVYVRSASNRVEILCTAVKDAMCQKRAPRSFAPRQAHVEQRFTGPVAFRRVRRQ